MRNFTYYCSVEQLHMTLIRDNATQLLLRDNDSGDFEVWVPHEGGLVIYQGRRYGYSHDASRGSTTPKNYQSN